jgi:hypothetical protein
MILFWGYGLVLWFLSLCSFELETHENNPANPVDNPANPD